MTRVGAAGAALDHPSPAVHPDPAGGAMAHAELRLVARRFGTQMAVQRILHGRQVVGMHIAIEGGDGVDLVRHIAQHAGAALADLPLAGRQVPVPQPQVGAGQRQLDAGRRLVRGAAAPLQHRQHQRQQHGPEQPGEEDGGLDVLDDGAVHIGKEIRAGHQAGAAQHPERQPFDAVAVGKDFHASQYRDISHGKANSFEAEELISGTNHRWLKLST